MSRRASSVPQTPVHNDDALERSIRRQQGSNRSKGSISDLARRVQDSPVSRGSQASRNSSSGNDTDDRSSRNGVVGADNFQEWMKMVRMKRVKANNAFAIQLIDAFHSMVQGEVLSQNGHNVSFQEATHTLGGCLTVYKNRIARVKDDTSKLLVGVNENKPSADDRADDDSDASNDDDDDNDEERKAAKKKRANRKKTLGTDAFLAPAKKLEIDTNGLATSIDPLLRKMSADFDKRGAGALLQYSLKLDKSGRLLLDAEAQEVDENRPRVPSRFQKQNRPEADQSNSLPTIDEGNEDEAESVNASDLQAATEDSNNEEPTDTSEPSERRATEGSQPFPTAGMYLAHFNIEYFANLDTNGLEALSMVDSIAKAVANPVGGTEALIKDMQAWAVTDPGDSSTYAVDEDKLADLDNAEFEDEGAEAALEGLGLGIPFDGEFNNVDIDDPAADSFDHNADHSEDVSLNSIVSSRLPATGSWMDIDYLQKLDSQKTNWAGPSFWKIRRLHARTNEDDNTAAAKPAGKSNETQSRKMASAASIIDFSQEQDVDLNDLFNSGSRSTLLSQKQYDLEDKHLLPVDMHVTTKQLVCLQLRPMTGIAPAFLSSVWANTLSQGANETVEADTGYDSFSNRNDSGAVDFNNDEDYYYGGWNEHPDVVALRPTTASAMFSHNAQSGYGAQSNQINFARVAKRVDVRLLKDNIWRTIQKDQTKDSRLDTPSQTPEAKSPKETSLLEIIHNTQPLYNEQQRSDLSPAMYFISLLHLSNEKGLSLQNTESLNDIRIMEANA